MKFPISIKPSSTQPHIYRVFDADGVQWGDIGSTDKEGVDKLVALANGGEMILRGLVGHSLEKIMPHLEAGLNQALAGTVEDPPPAQAQEEWRARPTTVDEQLANPANFRGDRTGGLYLARCMACGPPGYGRENWGPAVSSGTCAWCGWTEEDGEEEAGRREDADDWMGDWNN